MPKLIIQRSVEFNSFLGNFEITLNDQKLGIIRSGKSKVYELPKGTYTVKANIVWCGSPEKAINLKDDDRIIIEVSTFMYKNWSYLIMLFVAIIIFIFGESLEIPTEIGLLLIVPLLLYLLYYITIGRNRFLKLKLKKV